MKIVHIVPVLAIAAMVSHPAAAQAPQGAVPPSWPQTILAAQATQSATAVIVNAEGAARSGGVPQFQVDPFWPKPLPNHWILGQVSGIATDKYDRIWVVHRPTTLTPRERAAEQNPPEAKCCVAAPPVLVFDTSGNLLRHWGGPGPGYQWPEIGRASCRERV